MAYRIVRLIVVLAAATSSCGAGGPVMSRPDRRLALGIASILLLAACDSIDGLGGISRSGHTPEAVGDYGPGLHETDDRVWPLAATSRWPVDGLTALGMGRVVWQFGSVIEDTALYSVRGSDPDTVRAAHQDQDSLFLFVAPGIDAQPEGLCEQFACVEQ